jgi:hypothetical protein
MPTPNPSDGVVVKPTGENDAATQDTENTGCCGWILGKIPIPDMFYDKSTRKPLKSTGVLACTTSVVYILSMFVFLLCMAFYMGEVADKQVRIPRRFFASSPQHAQSRQRFRSCHERTKFFLPLSLSPRPQCHPL